MGWFPFNPNIGRWIQGFNSSTFLSRLKVVAEYHQKPVLGSTKTVHATLTCGEAIVTTTTAITQPDVPRNLVLTGNVGANEVVRANGLNAAGVAFYEDFTLNATTPIVGAKAFKTVVSIVTPIGTHTVDIVCGNVLGLAHKLAYDSALLKRFDNGTDTGTLAVSATVLESNTFAPSGTLNGSKYVDLAYLV
jgi:hypothetical protein